MSNLLLKFKSKDSSYGVTRETLKAVAREMDVSETTVVHLALSKIAQEVLPAYEADEGALSKRELQKISELAQKHGPQGKLLKKRSLL